MRRAVRLTVAPGEEWRTIKGEEPRARTIFGRFVLPLALMPAASWGLGLLLFGNDASGGHSDLDLVQIMRGSLIVYFGVVLSIGLCAVSIVILAPLFAGRRNWPRALQVAAYGAAPVLLGGVVLLVPSLAYVLILPFFHSLYLQYAGLQHVLGVRERDAAEYVALSSMLLMVFSTALGAFAGWLGIL
ncbi:MAG: YIP1 family protein [Betaproteobacteria bacterium]|nr:YIP1 family protein [Betaproteobacteria bacterium]